MKKTKKTYHLGPAKLAECWRCGRTEIPCSTYIADVPEYETGYVDEYHICSTCDDSEAIRIKLCEFLNAA